MTKLFRKIRQSLLTAKKSAMQTGRFKKYLMYAIGEIVLVVIGILIAVSINNWKQSLHLDKVEKNLYRDLVQELQTDLDEIHGNDEYNSKYLARYNQASEIILNDTLKQWVDTLATITIELTNFSDFKKEESAYNKLATSGNLELISNKKILKQLHNLSMLYNYINRLEKNQEQFMFSIVPKITDYIRRKPLQVMMPEKLYGYKFHNDIEVLILLGNEKDGLYKEAQRDLRRLINLLETEI